LQIQSSEDANLLMQKENGSGGCENSSNFFALYHDHYLDLTL